MSAAMFNPMLAPTVFARSVQRTGLAEPGREATMVPFSAHARVPATGEEGAAIVPGSKLPAGSNCGY